MSKISRGENMQWQVDRWIFKNIQWKNVTSKKYMLWGAYEKNQSRKKSRKTCVSKWVINICMEIYIYIY